MKVEDSQCRVMNMNEDGNSKHRLMNMSEGRIIIVNVCDEYEGR